jgi:hypothetical protein
VSVWIPMVLTTMHANALSALACFGSELCGMFSCIVVGGLLGASQAGLVLDVRIVMAVMLIMWWVDLMVM